MQFINYIDDNVTLSSRMFFCHYLNFILKNRFSVFFLPTILNELREKKKNI